MVNKNLRPYCISIDWLQLHLHRPADFSASAPRMASLFASSEDHIRWTFSELGHGSKTYRKIFLVKQRGVEWAELSTDPYSSAIHPLSVTLKMKNKVLYEPGLMADIGEFCEFLGFRFMGVSRLDLAYDCNEFYGGLLPSHLMKKYENGDIIKYGSGSGYRQFQQGYCLGFDTVTGKKTLTADVPLWKPSTPGEQPSAAYEEEVERQKVYADPRTLIKLPDERNPLLGGRPITEKSVPIVYTSTTWGSRSSGHQVQLYNKTLEMQQVAYKHHIATRWKSYGLDLQRDVWRLEIRITKNARLLETIDSSLYHLLDPRDLVLEQQIEQLFWDYSYKYFRWYTLDQADRRSSDGKKKRSLLAMLQHKDRLKPYRIFSCAKRNEKGELTEPLTHKFIPRVPVPQKDYSRGIKQALNVVEGAIKSMADAGNPNLIHLQETARHLSAVYGVEKRRLSEIRDFTAKALTSDCDYDIMRYYREHWQDVPTHWFDGTAIQRAVIAWNTVRGGAATQCYKELQSLGYDVHPAFAEQFLEHLLDTGEPLAQFIIQNDCFPIEEESTEMSHADTVLIDESKLMRLIRQKRDIVSLIQESARKEDREEISHLSQSLAEVIEEISLLRDVSGIENLSS